MLPLHAPCFPRRPRLPEIFNNLLASTADQMGVTLRNTASSVNVKERLIQLHNFCSRRATSRQCGRICRCT